MPLLLGLPLPALPGEVLHDAPVMRVGIARPGLLEPPAVCWHVVRDDDDPGREGEPEEHEVFLRLVNFDAVNPGERIDDIRRAHQLFRIGPAGILGRVRDGGIVARGQHRLGQLEAPQCPELRVARQEAV